MYRSVKYLVFRNMFLTTTKKKKISVIQNHVTTVWGQVYMTELMESRLYRLFWRDSQDWRTLVTVSPRLTRRSSVKPVRLLRTIIDIRRSNRPGRRRSRWYTVDRCMSSYDHDGRGVYVWVKVGVLHGLTACWTGDRILLHLYDFFVIGRFVYDRRLSLQIQEVTWVYLANTQDCLQKKPFVKSHVYEVFMGKNYPI